MQKDKEIKDLLLELLIS